MEMDMEGEQLTSIALSITVWFQKILSLLLSQERNTFLVFCRCWEHQGLENLRCVQHILLIIKDLDFYLPTQSSITSVKLCPGLIYGPYPQVAQLVKENEKENEVKTNMCQSL